MLNNQGRPTRSGEASTAETSTFTGNRALDMEEALIFEAGRLDATGVDIDEPAPFKSRLGPHARTTPIGLPGLAEPEAIRHYVRLSRNNYSIDAGIYPLGSCTMKHNPRLNEKVARLQGFADVHPLQPVSTAQGALEVIEALANAFRHASARMVRVTVRFLPKVLEVEISDDGEGMDDETLLHGRPGHFGLPGIRAHAQRIGATIAIESSRGTGTRIVLRIAARGPRRLWWRSGPRFGSERISDDDT